MYRLIDDIARTRILYEPPILTVPAVLVIDIPAQHRGRGLLLDRYYAILLETPDETAEMEQFLIAPRHGPVPPDLLDRRTSTLHTAQPAMIRYEPPAVGWPWLSVCHWPAGSESACGQGREHLARGCYTMEMFRSAVTLEAHQAMLLQMLARERRLTVRMIAGDTVPALGRC